MTASCGVRGRGGGESASAAIGAGPAGPGQAGPGHQAEVRMTCMCGAWTGGTRRWTARHRAVCRTACAALHPSSAAPAGRSRAAPARPPPGGLGGAVRGSKHPRRGVARFIGCTPRCLPARRLAQHRSPTALPRRGPRQPAPSLTRTSLAPYQRVAFMVRLSSFLLQMVAPGASAGRAEAAHGGRRVGGRQRGGGSGGGARPGRCLPCACHRRQHWMQEDAGSELGGSPGPVQGAPQRRGMAAEARALIGFCIATWVLAGTRDTPQTSC